MKINAKKSLVIIYNHIAHTFFKQGGEQWGSNKSYKGLSVFYNVSTNPSKLWFFTEMNSKIVKYNK